MAIAVHTVPFTLVEQSTGDSPVFGAAASGPVPTNWHWRADLSALPRYLWTVMFTSIILESSGPADYDVFAAPPQGNINFMPRAFAINGGTPQAWIIPLTSDIVGVATLDLDGPWRLSTDDNLTQGSATYYLTEALQGGDLDGPAFQWREPNWLANIDLPGKALTSEGGINELRANGTGVAYYTRPVESVDYWFSANSWWSPDLLRTNHLTATWNIFDARLIVLGCRQWVAGAMSPGAGSAGQRRSIPVHGAGGLTAPIAVAPQGDAALDLFRTPTGGAAQRGPGSRGQLRGG